MGVIGAWTRSGASPAAAEAGVQELPDAGRDPHNGYVAVVLRSDP